MIRPNVLVLVIIVSLSLALATNSGACNPFSVCGIAFWLSFCVLCLSCIHLEKYKEQYKRDVDEQP